MYVLKRTDSRCVKRFIHKTLRLALCVCSLKNMANYFTGETGKGWSQRDQRRERTKGGISGNKALGSMYLWLIMMHETTVRLRFVVQGDKGDKGLAGLSGWPGLIVSQFIYSP